MIDRPLRPLGSLRRGWCSEALLSGVGSLLTNFICRRLSHVSNWNDGSRLLNGRKSNVPSNTNWPPQPECWERLEQRAVQPQGEISDRAAAPEQLRDAAIQAVGPAQESKLP